VPIRPFLQGQAFDPEATEAMGIAFARARTALGLPDKIDAATEMVAMAIITAAGMGVRDPEELYAAVIEKLNWTPIDEQVDQNPQIRRRQLRAEECRTLADATRGEQARTSLLAVAAGYERLVKQAESSIPAAPPGRSREDGQGSEPG